MKKTPEELGSGVVVKIKWWHFDVHFLSTVQMNPTTLGILDAHACQFVRKVCRFAVTTSCHRGHAP